MMMRHLVAATTAILAMVAVDDVVQARETSGLLKEITRADMERETVVGTGCTWMSAQDGRTLFAATDGIAVIRTAAGLARLRPHPMAKDMFPFTFDRWVGPRIEVRVSETGKSRVVGTESTRTPAVISVMVGSRSSRTSGVLNCGS
jgi:hypothetical protein